MKQKHSPLSPQNGQKEISVKEKNQKNWNYENRTRNKEKKDKRWTDKKIKRMNERKNVSERYKEYQLKTKRKLDQ